MQSTTDDRIPQFTKWLENERQNISICDCIEWNRLKNTVRIEIEVMGTQFNNRSKLIENVHLGDSLKIVRDADNYYDRYTLSVCNMQGQELGTMWVKLADELSPLLDAGLAQITACRVKRVEPLSKRGEGAVKAILSIEFSVRLKQYNAAGVIPDNPGGTAGSHMAAAAQKPPVPQIQPEQSAFQRTETFGAPRQQTLSSGSSGVAAEQSTLQAKSAEVLSQQPELSEGVHKKLKRKSSRTWLFVLVAGILIWITLIGGGVYYSRYVYIPSKHYEKGCELYAQEKYLLAVDEFRRAEDYLDAKQKIEKCYEQLNAD